MARAIWTGSVSFGLVNVPVGLFSATEDHDVHFHQFEKGTSSRIRNQRVNEDTGEEVAYSDIVKGAEVGEGYVMLTPEELESVEPGRSRTIEISDFVDAGDIDPVYYQKSYYMAPADDAAKKAYRLLVKAMAKADRIGVATFVMRGKQYLAAIRPSDDENVLVLSTMYFADEVRDPAKELDGLPNRTQVAEKDLKMAVSLIESLTTEWDPQHYRDTYTERVEELIEAKKKNREVVVPDTSEEAASEEVGSLLETLRASIDASKGHKPGNTHNVTKLETRKAEEGTTKESSKKGGSKKTAAKKASAKKSASKKSASKKSAGEKSAGEKSSRKKQGTQKRAGKKAASSNRRKAS